MLSMSPFIALLVFFLSLCAAQTASSTAPTITPPPSSSISELPTPPASTTSSASPTGTRSSFPTISSSGNRTSKPPTGSTPPDVWLNVPTLSVKRIELVVEDLKADINLNAQVAGLVSINVGVAVGIQKVNITIADVSAEVELIVRLGNLVQIVQRVFESLDLNPLLLGAVKGVTDLVDDVVGAVDGLLGSITQGDTKLSFLVDNLGNIVQSITGGGGGEGAGGAEGGGTRDSIVGNYQQNMTFTGETKQLSNGNVQRTYSYTPLGALVNVVFNSANQVVRATVVKPDKKGGGGSPAGSAAPKPAPSTGAGRRT